MSFLFCSSSGRSARTGKAGPEDCFTNSGVPRSRTLRSKKGRCNGCSGIHELFSARTSNKNQTRASGEAEKANSTSRSLCFQWTSCHCVEQKLCLATQHENNFLLHDQWSFLDRQHFSKHWPHGEIIQELLGDENNGNQSLRERKHHGSFPMFVFHCVGKKCSLKSF